MKEIILSDVSMNEVMVDLDSNGKIEDVYTYKGNKISFWNDNDIEINLTADWKTEFNSCFAHCPKAKRHSTIKRMLSMGDYGDGFTLVGAEQEEIEAFWDMLRYYKWMDEDFTLRLDIG